MTLSAADQPGPFFFGTPVVVDCITDTAGFRSLREDWRNLYDKCPGATPFNSWEWLFSWWEAYGDGRQLRLLVWRANRTAIGIVPLYAVREPSELGIDCRVLKFIGDGTFDSDNLGFLIDPAARELIIPQFCEWLRGKTREWDALVLRELPEHSVLPEAIQQTAKRCGFDFRLEYGRRAVLDLPAGFDEFLRSRSPRFRTKLRALLRKLDEGGIAFEEGCAPPGHRRRLRSLFTLHQSRWSESGAPGVFGTVPKRRFYGRFVPRFAANGWLRFYSLRSGPTFLAHQLCFGGNGITYLLQEGFDVSDSAASYGQMLRAAVVRNLIQRGETHYDFLGGFSKHKEDWGAREEKIIHIIVARKQWRGWLYFNGPIWRERIATEAKRVLPASVLHRLRRAIAVDSGPNTKRSPTRAKV